MASTNTTFDLSISESSREVAMVAVELAKKARRRIVQRRETLYNR